MANRREQTDLNMEQNKVVAYKLFAMLTTEKNVAVATQYRFQRITPNYILVYGEEEPDGVDYTEVTANEIQNLSRRDFQWLEDANILLIREFSEGHKESQEKSFAIFLQELDKNLKEEIDGERKEKSTAE